MDPDTVFAFLTEPDSDGMSSLTAQMSAKQGLKWLSQARAETIMIKLEQLVYQKVMAWQQAKQLTQEQKQVALK